MGRRNSENNDRRTEQFRKLFIGGLTPQTDEIRLKKYYEQWGELVDFVVMKDNKTGRSRGFGFVTYRDPHMVDEAQNNRPHEIDGKIVEAKRAMPREDSNTPESHMTVNKLFVGGLKKDITKDQLREYFGKFGTVIDCEIVTWKDSGESRGFGFVTFDDYDPVDKAILYKPHQITSSRVDVKKALSKDEMEEIKRKQTVDGIPINSPTINNNSGNLTTEYYGSSNNKSNSSYVSINHLNRSQTNLTNTGSCIPNVIFDASIPSNNPNTATSYHYPTIATSWNPNFYCSRPITDLNSQYFTQSLINLNNIINGSVVSPPYEISSAIQSVSSSEQNVSTTNTMETINIDECNNSKINLTDSNSNNSSSNNIQIF